MRLTFPLMLILAAGAGCSGGGSDETRSATNGAGADVRPVATAATPADEARALDQGPRAARALTLDGPRAERGAVLFETKSCADCHTLGDIDLAPDLLTVLDKRTLPWLRRQITDPEWMLAHDPITKEIYEEFGIEMVDMDVDPTEADDILHYLLRETSKARK